MQTANNSLTAKKTTGMIEYEVNGEMVQMNASMVKNYLVSGSGNVTDAEVVNFMSLCRFHHLNPFVKEAYLIKYGNSPATMVTGKDTFTKRARKAPDFDGFQAGIIVIGEDGTLTEREGSFKLPNEQLVGGWAKCYLKGQSIPRYESVTFEEYAGRKSNGELNNQWATKPATMIRKVALVHVLRETFPDYFEGLYSPEEIPVANFIVDEAPDKIVPSEQKEPEKIEEKQDQIEGQMTIDNPAMASLFGGAE